MPVVANIDPQDVSQPLPAGNAPSQLPEDERVELFSIPQPDGTMRAIYVPKAIGPNVALQYLRDVRRNGQQYAIAGMMDKLLGPEGMDALADYDDLTEEDLEAVMAAVQKHVLGPLERGKGKR